MQGIVIFIVSMIIMIMGIFYTRLISILFWNNSAFVVLSIVMLGISASGLTIYLLPRIFTPSRFRDHFLYLLPLLSITIVVSCAGIINDARIHVVTINGNLLAMLPATSWALLPFYVGGLSVSWILTHGSQNISRLYFYDMCGAALGALLTVGLIYYFNGIGLLFFLAGFLAAFAAIYAVYQFKRALAIFSVFVLLGITLCWVNPALRKSFVITHAKGGPVEPSIFTQWDPVGRITISPGLFMKIDNGVGTPIIRYNGNPKSVAFLHNNVLQLAYNLGPFEKVVIIGPGGGSDVLSALIFGNQNITAVEINQSIIDAMQHRMARINGNIYNDPRVQLVHMDGRAYVAKLDDKVNLIQATFIDTYTSGASGSQTVSENYLYTTSALNDYLDHLIPDGILSMSRWGGKRNGYSETFRVAALAQSALSERGIANPGDHVIIVQGPAVEFPGPKQGYQVGNGTRDMATILISNSPFSEEQKAQLRKTIQEKRFRPLWFPGAAHNNPLISTIFNSQDAGFYPALYQKTGFDMSPISDDRPFFFQMLKPIDFFAFNKRFGVLGGEYIGKYRGAHSVWQALAALSVLVGLLVIAPLLLRWRDVQPVRQHIPLLTYFMGIGLGYMGIELGLIHRFALFLEHPIYALSVVIASLPMASGIGSFITSRIQQELNVSFKIGTLLIGMLILYMIALPVLLHPMMGWPFIVKCIVAALLVLPLGLVMGMLFPIGVKIIPAQSLQLMPWLWGINTGFSVFAGVLSMFIGMNSGLNIAWIFFTVAYALSPLSAWYMLRHSKAA